LRRFLLLLLTAAVAVAGFVGTSRSGTEAAGSYAFGAHDQAPRIVLRRDQAPADFTGGAITAADGETVTVYVQDALLAVDPAANQHWADVLAGLLHGTELSQMTLFVATLDRVRQLCGAAALGCYSPRAKTIVGVGQDLQSITAQAVVTHEYGHHVANSRDNEPWPAVDWGTKRWASYLNVCRRAETGDFFPGDEERFYELNPGEAFAEDYRVLNERRAGLPETAWRVVSPSLYPDQTALDALALDVTSPWAGNTDTTYKTVLGPRATGRGFRIATPYDGSFSATLTSPAKARLTLRVVDLGSGKVLAEDSTPVRAKRVSFSLCGQRAVWVQVKRVSGSASVTLAVSKP
jgi:hypothetical protein